MRHFNERSDEEIIEEIKQGNISAFEEIVKRYQRPLLAFVYHIINDEIVSEDIVQDTFIKIYKSIEKIDTSRKFSTFVFEVAKNTAISYLRSRKNSVYLTKVDIESDENLYEKMIQIHDEGRIKKAISTLRKNYRNVVRLYYFRDLSYVEIADKLHLPINTIRTNLRRAKKSLKKILEEYEEKF